MTPIIFSSGGLCGLSVVLLAQLYEGIYCTRDPHADARALREFLMGIGVVGGDQETCQIVGRERGRLGAAGALVGDFGLLVGATALRHDLTLLTNNRRHFERIEGLRIMSLLLDFGHLGMKPL